jgi:hypothetical protein
MIEVLLSSGTAADKKTRRAFPSRTAFPPTGSECRSNWTFVGSDRGGRTMAVLRSFVASCELAKVDLFAWFHDVLSRTDLVNGRRGLQGGPLPSKMVSGDAAQFIVDQVS